MLAMQLHKAVAHLSHCCVWPLPTGSKLQVATQLGLKSEAPERGPPDGAKTRAKARVTARGVIQQVVAFVGATVKDVSNAERVAYY